MKKIAILGSTGSIGQSTLKVVDHLGSEELRVVALAAHGSIDLLETQIRRYRPVVVGVFDIEKAQELARRLPDVEIIGGEEGVNAVATCAEADMVVSAISGTRGLIPTVAAITAGKDVALANKEPLVSAGELVTGLAQKHGVSLLPVDSEHSAIFQCLQGEARTGVRRIILTASGGPFRQCTDAQLDHMTAEDALKHPTWDMGPKVTIDCSTLMNKGLELIEAHWLFDVAHDDLDVVVHPQSIIHSMVEFVDGSLLAQMGEPTMVTPIQYALTYPRRLPGMLQPFDFCQHGTLEFYAPDTQRFRCLALAKAAIREGGSFPGYMNAANEVLVHRFLDHQFGWRDIAERLDGLMEHHNKIAVGSIEDVEAIDTIARQDAANC